MTSTMFSALIVIILCIFVLSNARPILKALREFIKSLNKNNKDNLFSKAVSIQDKVEYDYKEAVNCMYEEKPIVFILTILILEGLLCVALFVATLLVILFKIFL